MARSVVIALAITVFNISNAITCDEHGLTGFLPANDLRIYVGDKNTSNITKEVFTETLSRISSVYVPVIAKKGAKLTVNYLWEDPTVNAVAKQDGMNWQIDMYGGLARHPLITSDAFMMVACHELGHHIGGAPKKLQWGSMWASNEGQSDYFASLKCMRKLLESDDNVFIVSGMEVDREVTLKCAQVYKSKSELALCQRIAMAAKSLSQLLGSFSGALEVSFLTPDQTKVTKTEDSHPSAQCRLDTYFSGALCDKSLLDEVDPTDPVKGVCLKKDGDLLGVRPLCWYKPTQAEL